MIQSTIVADAAKLANNEMEAGIDTTFGELGGETDVASNTENATSLTAEEILAEVATPISSVFRVADFDLPLSAESKLNSRLGKQIRILKKRLREIQVLEEKQTYATLNNEEIEKLDKKGGWNLELFRVQLESNKLDAEVISNLNKSNTLRQSSYNAIVAIAEEGGNTNPKFTFKPKRNRSSSDCWDEKNANKERAHTAVIQTLNDYRIMSFNFERKYEKVLKDLRSIKRQHLHDSRLRDEASTDRLIKCLATENLKLREAERATVLLNRELRETKGGLADMTLRDELKSKRIKILEEKNQKLEVAGRQSANSRVRDTTMVNTNTIIQSQAKKIAELEADNKRWKRFVFTNALSSSAKHVGS